MTGGQLGTGKPSSEWSIEEYARYYNKLHPLIIKVLAPYFPTYNLERIQVKIKPKNWWCFRVANSAQGGGEGYMPAFVSGRTLYMMEGVLNQDYPWNLYFPHAWGNVAHEVMHAFQDHRDGRVIMWGRYIGGFFKSLFTHGKGWCHDVIEFEQEAIEFGKVVESEIMDKMGHAFLERMKQY